MPILKKIFNKFGKDKVGAVYLSGNDYIIRLKNGMDQWYMYKKDIDKFIVLQMAKDFNIISKTSESIPIYGKDYSKLTA